MKKQDKSYFSINEIYQAPENRLLYDKFSPNSDEDDYKLYQSIKEVGILEPLHISADMCLLSGHRRLAAAHWLGLNEVPCIVVDNILFNDLSSDERLEILAKYNKQRDKSHAERLREAMQEIDPDEAYEHLLKDRHKRP